MPLEGGGGSQFGRQNKLCSDILNGMCLGGEGGIQGVKVKKSTIWFTFWKAMGTFKRERCKEWQSHVPVVRAPGGSRWHTQDG